MYFTDPDSHWLWWYKPSTMLFGARCPTGESASAAAKTETPTPEKKENVVVVVEAKTDKLNVEGEEGQIREEEDAVEHEVSVDVKETQETEHKDNGRVKKPTWVSERVDTTDVPIWKLSNTEI